MRDVEPNPEKCKQRVWSEDVWTANRQCARKPWKDGYCKQHHPDTKAEREKKRRAERHLEFERQTREARLRRVESEIVRCALADDQDGLQGAVKEYRSIESERPDASVVKGNSDE